MPSNARSAASPYHPTTFLERGVALPFTTPLLGGTRARLSRDRRMELIVPNPSGGQGVYVMPWTAIATLCRPTLYDKILNTRIACLETLTPATVRAVARATAAEGFAGEAAMDAVRAAAEADESDQRSTIHHLLSALIRQVNLEPNGSSAIPGPDSADLDTRARQVIAWLAPRLGQVPGWGVGALHGIGTAFAGLGIVATGETGRIARLVTLLRTVCASIAEWAGNERDGDRAEYANLICTVSELTLSLVAGVLAKVRSLTTDMVGLLRTWVTDPESIIRLAARPEWLLDGWEQICLIWNFAPDTAARRAALVEIAEYIPALPREANEWSGRRSDREDVFFGRQPIALNEDWRTGAAVFDLIARNEQFHAAAP